MLTPKTQTSIILLAESRIGLMLPEKENCTTFIKGIYSKVGVPTDFFQYPILAQAGLYKQDFAGYPCFLKRRATRNTWKRYSHAGIIIGDGTVIHYSRNMSSIRDYIVRKSTIEEILKIYSFV